MTPVIKELSLLSEKLESNIGESGERKKNDLFNLDELNDMNIKITSMQRYFEEKIENSMKNIHLIEELIKMCACAEHV